MKEKYLTPLIHKLSLVEEGLLCLSAMDTEGFYVESTTGDWDPLEP